MYVKIRICIYTYAYMYAHIYRAGAREQSGFKL